jgi:hypothetical protein
LCSMRRSSLLGRPVLRALRTTFSTTSICVLSLQPPNKCAETGNRPTCRLWSPKALGFFGDFRGPPIKRDSVSDSQFRRGPPALYTKPPSRLKGKLRTPRSTIYFGALPSFTLNVDGRGSVPCRTLPAVALGSLACSQGATSCNSGLPAS